MAIKRVEAFVIKKIDFKDSDYIVTLFGRESGKFAGIAKGARKSESKFGGVFDLLNFSEVVYYPGSGLDFFSEGELLRSWEGLRTTPEGINAGLRCARTIDRTLEDGGVEKGAFDLFYATLSALNEDQKGVRVPELAFYLKLFRVLGYRPELRRCVECGESLEGETNLWFYPESGGTLCRECASGKGVKISGGLRKKLIKLSSLPQSQIRRLKFSEEELGRGFLILARFGRYHFDRSLVPKTLSVGGGHNYH
ncbi:DNA repair protein RecO [Candidatus Bipolaricaulota bacterium]|nr:DNA repair protein RecO [Candidatus Bipolaricaulota bacterium]